MKCYSYLLLLFLEIKQLHYFIQPASLKRKLKMLGASGRVPIRKVANTVQTLAVTECMKKILKTKEGQTHLNREKDT